VLYQQYVTEKEKKEIKEECLAEKEKANRAQQKYEAAEKISKEKDQAAKKLENENDMLKGKLENITQERERELIRLQEKVCVIIFFKAAAKVVKKYSQFSKLCFICNSRPISRERVITELKGKVGKLYVIYANS